MVEQNLTGNCDACGTEEFEDDLKTVKIASFKRSLRLCEKCFAKKPSESLKDAADILSEITKVAIAKERDPERRLSIIRKLLGVL